MGSTRDAAIGLIHGMAQFYRTRRRSTLYRFIGAATNLITERLPEALRGVALQELCERSAYIALCNPVMHHIDLAPASGFQQFLTS